MLSGSRFTGARSPDVVCCCCGPRDLCPLTLLDAASCANPKAARISLGNERRLKMTMTTSVIRAGTTSRSGEPSLDEVTRQLAARLVRLFHKPPVGPPGLTDAPNGFIGKPLHPCSKPRARPASHGGVDRHGQSHSLLLVELPALEGSGVSKGPSPSLRIHTRSLAGFVLLAFRDTRWSIPGVSYQDWPAL